MVDIDIGIVMDLTSFNLVSRDVGLSGSGTKLVILSVASTFVASLLVFNRIYWRFKIGNNLGLDDVTILSSLCFLFGLNATNIAAVDFGYGREFAWLSYDDAAMALMLVYVGEIFYIVTLNLTKIAIALLYLRIFERLWFRAFCRAIIEMAILAIIGFCGAKIVQCSPISAAWQETTSYGTCIHMIEFWHIMAGFNITTDVMLAIMPSIALIPLKISRSMKFFLSAAFGLGLFVSVVSIFRAINLFDTTQSYDETASDMTITIWSTTEASMGVICACLPMLRQLIEVWFPNIFPSPELQNNEMSYSDAETISSSIDTFHDNNSNTQLCRNRFSPAFHSPTFHSYTSRILGPNRPTSTASFPSVAPSTPQLRPSTPTPRPMPQRSLRRSRRSNIWRDVQTLYSQEGWTHPSPSCVERMAIREDARITAEEAAEQEMIKNKLARLVAEITDEEKLEVDQIRRAASVVRSRSRRSLRVAGGGSGGSVPHSWISAVTYMSVFDADLPAIFSHEFRHEVFPGDSDLIVPTAADAVFFPLRQLDFGLTIDAGLHGGKLYDRGNSFNESRF